MKYANEKGIKIKSIDRYLGEDLDNGMISSKVENGKLGLYYSLELGARGIALAEQGGCIALKK